MKWLSKIVDQIIKEELSKIDIETSTDRILNDFRDKISQKGIDVSSLKKLGTGTMGTAYDMGCNKVLKITADKREAQASSLVAGKDIPNIVKVYSIWKFSGINWYGLIIEKLTPLSKEEENLLTSAVINTGFPVYLHAANDNWNEAMRALAQAAVKKFYAAAYTRFPDAAVSRDGQGTKDPRIQSYVKANLDKTVQDFDRVTKEYKMRSLFKSLQALGIRYYDFHGGNYGRRADGTLVLFDLGRSISKGAEPVELEEKFNLLERRFGPSQPIRELV